MFSFTKPVAWRDWSEWKETYKMLFSDNEKDIARGCARVSAWSAKQVLPIAVEVTASLQRELHGTENAAALSMALVRFINGVVEPFKNSNLSVPISTIGASYGIPEFIVTLRHSATHGKQPTYEFAAIGAKAALDWLKRNYWEAQLEHLKVIESDMRESILAYLMKSESPFEGFDNNTIRSFGVNGIVKIALNPNQTRKTISQAFMDKIIQLLKDLEPKHPSIPAAFSIRIAEETAKGNSLAAFWLDYLCEKEILPKQTINLILRWAKPELLGGAIPFKLISIQSDFDVTNDKIRTLNKELDPPEWPPTSLGNMPINDDMPLTLTNDEYSFVEPNDGSESEELEELPEQNKQNKDDSTIQMEPPENLLELW